MEARAQWTGKKDELEYKMGLINRYMELKNLAMPNKQILMLFPEMKNIIKSNAGGGDNVVE